MNDLSKVNDFKQNRLSVLEFQLAKYWLQAGRTPDPAALATMALAIEVELPSWIGGDFLTNVIVSMRQASRATPCVSTIIAEAKALSQQKARPAVSTALAIDPPKGNDTWRELVNYRLRLQSDSNAIAPTPWYTDMGKKLPSHQEREAFLEMLAECPKYSRSTTFAHWVGRKPYAATMEELEIRIADPQEA